MGISVSHSSSPNWHLTAAPHGLLVACVSTRFFPGVGSSSNALNITQLRGHCLLRPFIPLTPSPILHSLPLQLSHAGRSLHPRQPQALIIASLSLPVALKSTPPAFPHRPPPPPPHLLPIPLSLSLWKSSGKKTAGYWRRSASRLRAKKDSAYGRHMATFSKSYLYLTRPINQEQISFSVLVAWQKACSRTDAGSKFVWFYIL